MSKFFELVGYEYKKMLGHKSMIIVFALSLAVMIIGQTVMVLPIFPSWYEGENRWEYMVRDREYARALSGRAIDADLLMEAVESRNAGDFRAYRHILRLINQVYGTALVTPENAGDFYALRRHQVEDWLGSGRSAELLLSLDARITEPWVFEYAGAFMGFFDGSVASLLAGLLIAVGIAPLFAREHSTGVAQLMLTSRHGKSTLIWAKIFTAISFSILISLFFTAASFLTDAIIFGFDGTSAPFQLSWWTHSPYPITMGQAALIFSATLALRIVLFGSVLLLLSAKFKSSFAVTIFAAVWMFAALLFYVPIPVVWLENFTRMFIRVLPFPQTVFLAEPYEIFGLAIIPFVVDIIAALVASAAVLPFAARGFRKYQVGG